jgi:UDP-hydrolysing UDP-N-acetyl-D-glucosamine 2-epimerase
MLACRRRGATVVPVLYASALDARYGDVRASLAADDFHDVRGLHCHTDEGMSATTGSALVQWQAVLPWLNPDAVVVVGDRHEQMAPAIAAAYANVRLIHTMGGERTGSIDDKVRDAITALADVHCVATYDAQMRVAHIKGSGDYGEVGGQEFERHRIHLTGCPRIDTVKEALEGETRRAFLPMLMVSQHPVTTEWQLARAQMAATLEAVGTVATERQYAVELFWPNGDAGTGGTAEAIRAWLNSPATERLQVRTHRTMGPAEYARMMAATKCLVGNSSSGIREGAWIGTPVVQVGTRQSGREVADNVCTLSSAIGGPISRRLMLRGLLGRIDAGPRPSSALYGDGTAGEKVASAIMGAGA